MTIRVQRGSRVGYSVEGRPVDLLTSGDVVMAGMLLPKLTHKWHSVPEVWEAVGAVFLHNT